MKNKEHTPTPMDDVTQEAITGCQAAFQVILAQDIAEMSIPIPDDVAGAGQKAILGYITEHMDDACVTNRHTDDHMFIHAESVKILTGKDITS